MKTKIMAIKTPPILDRVQFILPEGAEWGSINLEDTVGLLDEHLECLDASAHYISESSGRKRVPLRIITQQGFNVTELCKIIPTITHTLVGDSGMFNAHKDCMECNAVSTIKKTLKDSGVKTYFTPQAFDTVPACSFGILTLVKEVLAA